MKDEQIEEKSYLSHKQMAILLKRCYRAGQPLFMWGPVGIGKSMMAVDVFRDVAKEDDRKFVQWNKLPNDEKKSVENDLKSYCVFVDDRVSLKDTTDNKGIPMTQDGYLKWVKTNIINLSCKKDAMIIWFKDEMNTAMPTVLNAELQWILDKAIDDMTFSDKSFTFAAGNRQEDRANVHELPYPLRNRFAHATLRKPFIDDWVEWAFKNGIDQRIVTFLQFKGSFLFKIDYQAKENAFPTPRSWQFASNLINGVKDMELIDLFLSSCVGYAITQEFMAWLRLNQNVNLDEILDNPTKIKDYQEMDLVTSIVSGIAERYKANDKLLEKALGVVVNMPRKEIAIHMLRLLKTMNRQGFTINAPKTKYMKDIMEYTKYLL